jgi:hypothetical protein
MAIRVRELRAHTTWAEPAHTETYLQSSLPGTGRFDSDGLKNLKIESFLVSLATTKGLLWHTHHLLDQKKN